MAAVVPVAAPAVDLDAQPDLWECCAWPVSVGHADGCNDNWVAPDPIVYSSPIFWPAGGAA